jgi:hypothetical protein
MGRASFLLESVERGRLGRASWMGAGSRLVTLAEAEELSPILRRERDLAHQRVRAAARAVR